MQYIQTQITEKSKLRVTGLCVGKSPGTGKFSAQMANNAENVSIWWRHHGPTLSDTEPEVSRVVTLKQIVYPRGRKISIEIHITLFRNK